MLADCGQAGVGLNGENAAKKGNWRRRKPLRELVRVQKDGKTAVFIAKGQGGVEVGVGEEQATWVGVWYLKG